MAPATSSHRILYGPTGVTALRGFNRSEGPAVLAIYKLINKRSFIMILSVYKMMMVKGKEGGK